MLVAAWRVLWVLGAHLLAPLAPSARLPAGCSRQLSAERAAGGLFPLADGASLAQRICSCWQPRRFCPPC